LVLKVSGERYEVEELKELPPSTERQRRILLSVLTGEQTMVKSRKSASRSKSPAAAKSNRYPRTPGRVAFPPVEIDFAAELERLRSEPPWKRTGRNARTIVKQPDLRVVLVSMKAGTRLDEHHAPGTITIHALSGRVRVHVPASKIDLPAGRMVALAETVKHDVEAVGDSAFLLSIAWRDPAS
jgi:quercetin dioxygenase-like cupin family protein